MIVYFVSWLVIRSSEKKVKIRLFNDPLKMSKISSEQVRQTVGNILKESVEAKRNFTETIELQINLKNYDTKKDKRFSGQIKLATVTKPKLRICIFADQQHCDEATKIGAEFMDIEALKKIGPKNKKGIKQLAKSYDAFLASETILRQVPKLLGPGLNKVGKFPTLLTHNEDMATKINEVKSTIKFQLKKVLCLAVAVGHVNLTEREIATNVIQAINFLVSLLKKQWQNVKTLYIKSTMGPSHRIY
ncbi:S60 ribosomal protein L10a [Cavenderia fasciculata]|uniref:S60 ribosomal protein L10a n=1 Tax=Cavenderia fasciculata TaxID=261658 RepID=F4PUG3_CACFS|nr:S60 ribosomal protein L10a [Cavenderia fasciculata]EGG21035.1 S60 ribosomal protein L10a [Cavenderia fasciculata]|eukprot:XP_004358885.1 S60 ribosomal protein L10a [Cavenderia fasciculata]